MPLRRSTLEGSDVLPVQPGLRNFGCLERLLPRLPGKYVGESGRSQGELAIRIDIVKGCQMLIVAQRSGSLYA